jgi:transcriptional regulator with XRE-family HTH domain
MKVGKTLKGWRTKRGYTQRQLAEIAGVKDEKMIGRYENDRAFPCVKSTLPALCDALGIKLEIFSSEVKNWKPKQ